MEIIFKPDNVNKNLGEINGFDDFKFRTFYINGKIMDAGNIVFVEYGL
jgi:hypothetical protein